MSTPSLAQRLLDAHVEYQIAQLHGPAFEAAVVAEVEHALSNAKTLKLDDVMTAERIQATAYKYVALLRLPGSIPEIAGDIADRLLEHPAQDDFVLGEVVGRHHVVAIASKLAESPALRERIVERLAASPMVRSWLAEVLYQVIADSADANRRLAERVPGMSTALSLGDRVASTVTRGRAGDEISLRTREYAERVAQFVLGHAGRSLAGSLDDETVVDAVLELWDEQADQPIASALSLINRDDLQDLLVIGYEFWQDVRGSEYLKVIVDFGVEVFFNTYGQMNLRDLLEEFGLGHDDLIEEAMRFAPPIIELLDERGLLDGIIRRRLEPFYSSPEVAALLTER